MADMRVGMRFAANQNCLSLSLLATRLFWALVTLLLIFLPFQQPVNEHLNLPREALWVDELFIVMLFFLFVLKLSYDKTIRREAFAVVVVLFLIVLNAVVSVLYNATPARSSAGAIFNYVKNFLVIGPMCCLLMIRKKNVIGVYTVLHRLAVFLCLFAVIQEIAFLVGFPVEKLGVHWVDIRFGLMRTPSLMKHPTGFGLYAALFFVLDLSVRRRMAGTTWLLLAGVLLSVSRVAWVCSCLSFSYIVVAERKKITGLLLSAFAMGLVLMILYSVVARDWRSQRYFRRYTTVKSVEVWLDHPVLGVGPGMFGSWITHAAAGSSAIFEKYRFDPIWLAMMRKHRTLDQFWFQILAEGGILNTVAFVVLFVVLWRIALKKSRRTKNVFQSRLLFGLSAAPIIVAIYCFGNVLNVTSVLLTYCVVLGMALGMPDEVAEKLDGASVSNSI